jgi:hypothetical protein
MGHQPGSRMNTNGDYKPEKSDYIEKPGSSSLFISRGDG